MVEVRGSHRNDGTSRLERECGGLRRGMGLPGECADVSVR
jgi:hypothetical protein